MRIKCTSIDLELANPIKNSDLIIKEIEKAEKEKVDILVFGKNVLTGSNLGIVDDNKTLSREKDNAVKKIKDFINEKKYPMAIFYEEDEEHLFESSELYNFLDSNIILNRYQDIDTLNNNDLRRDLYKIHSYETNGLYISCANGFGESTTDGVCTSYKSICFKGKILAETTNKNLIYDFDENLLSKPGTYRNHTLSDVEKEPFMPKGKNQSQIFGKILELQGKGLIQKMKSMNRNKIILGISGGLDSTVALMSCVNIFKKYNLPLTNIIGITMPGLGTTDRTYNNALDLMKATGITMYDIDLKQVLNMTIKNLGLDENDFGLTYQQTQSRERTQILLDFANKENGIVIGTGCMSEFALGWMTYGGDHLSMYAIAVGLPKTLVKHMSQYFLANIKDEKLHAVLSDIIDTPVSPELAPVNEQGEQNQKTEKIIGDYVLQDFFLYHIMVNNFSIKHIFELACIAFENDFTKEEIFKALSTFVGRFFSRQYKKNCFAEGIQILDYSLSPRVKCRMPGDLSDKIWKNELEEIKKEFNL